LSGSPDANVHVWSLPRLLSFSKPSRTGHDQKPPNFPIRTLSHHRTAITALAVGHSGGRTNIAISAAKDNTAIVWDYHTGNILRIFLLPSTALCVTIDPADRSFYAGYETGSVQLIDFYKTPSTQHPLHDPLLRSTPLQISADDQWSPPSTEVGSAECLTLSHDGMILLSGHQNGVVLSWDIARGKYASTVVDYTHPITNLQMLPPSGFPQHPMFKSNIIVHTLIKPRYDHTMKDALHANGLVPSNYTFSAQLTPSKPSISIASSSVNSASSPKFTQSSQFSEALTHPFFPQSLIDEGLAELAASEQHRGIKSQIVRIPTVLPNPEQGVMESSNQVSRIQSLESEITSLKKRLSTNETARHATVEEVIKLRSDLASLRDYANELDSKQEKSERDKFLARARREERDLKRRQAWFEAEKRGQDGDAVVRKMRAVDESETSELDYMSSDEHY
jgi:pre-rRNA-processing protein IPI3